MLSVKSFSGLPVVSRLFRVPGLPAWRRIIGAFSFVLCAVVAVRILIEVQEYAGKKAALRRPLSAQGTFNLPEDFLVRADVAVLARGIAKRDIFAYAPARPLAGAVIDAVSLKLSAVSFLDYPEAIIEDSKNNSMYVVKEGDFIEGAVVKKINADGVQLDYHGEEIILR